MKKFFVENKKKLIGLVVAVAVAGGGFLFFAKTDKTTLAVKSLSAFEKISKFLPITEDTKKEIEVVNKLVEEFTKKDDAEGRFPLLLQNNMELRPGGGFLGQYAIIKIKNGQVVSTFVEDANLLDRRITAKVAPPYPFTRMMQIKKWKFRDSNFSPDFPINAEKAKYFHRLSGGSSDFDGVIAVNASVLNGILKLTGPIMVSGNEFNGDNAVLKLEEVVEKMYIGRDDIDSTNRKWIMKQMAPIIIDKLFKINNISKLADFFQNEMRNKDVMLNFRDPNLQALAESVHWDGKVAQDWDGDYLMAVDANMGALKSDYFIKREMNYDIDLTAEKPTVTLNILYTHTATYGDWRTSDYHSYLRVYVPKGANLLERKMVSYPLTQEEFGKTYFGFILHVLINGQTNVMLKYELPAEFKEKDYRLLIQKQSGVGDVPVKVHLKTKDGEFNQETTLKKDLKFEFE